jgi:acetoin utilization deacetylase AcuC-like enzyme
MKHSTCPPSEVDAPNAPPENAKRLSVIIDNTSGILRASNLQKKLTWLDSTAATISDVLRVHDWSYIRKLQYACSQIGRNEERSDGISHLDGDTAVSNLSFAASLHGAGAVCNAVDLVVNGSVTNAFAAVRPPGHHAGPRGVVPGPEGGPDSHGFCLLNNVSIGAAYALNVHRDKIKRVAIVDFDVHHGNGTEETITWLLPGVEKSEVVTSGYFGVLEMPRYKPWYMLEITNYTCYK